MRFRLTHETRYNYDSPASESVSELRLCPLDGSGQRVVARTLTLDPQVEPVRFTDSFGNAVEAISIPFRHNHLRVKMSAEVITMGVPEPEFALERTVAEARRLSPVERIQRYPYRMATDLVPLGKDLNKLDHPPIRDHLQLRAALHELNHWIFSTFKYQPGVTSVSTPIAEIICNRAGVCQDFAHLMLAILRTHGIPARYVSGYIEAVDPSLPVNEALLGATASHAWVEVGLPGGEWWGLDPTNNQVVGERHIKIAVGRDYRDVAPLRGTYKGAYSQKLKVIVSMKRRTPPGTKA